MPCRDKGEFIITASREKYGSDNNNETGDIDLSEELGRDARSSKRKR